MEQFSLLDIVTILAIVAGPIVAVILTRWLDDRRFRAGRRLEIFQDLMRTRRLRLSPHHVSALNLVEIEFHADRAVISAWKDYITLLAKSMPKTTPADQIDAHLKDGDRALTKLLDAMGKELGFKIAQLDIYEGGYTPQGWVDVEQQQHALRLLAIDLLKGNRAIPVTSQVNPSPSNPYPPPPDQKAIEDAKKRIAPQ